MFLSCSYSPPIRLGLLDFSLSMSSSFSSSSPHHHLLYGLLPRPQFPPSSHPSIGDDGILQ